MKCFKTYITYIYILLSGIESYFGTLYIYLAFEQKHIQNPFKYLRWNAFACPFALFGPKHAILDAWIGSEYACNQNASNNILCHHKKCLMGYFEFLYGSGIICLPLNIPEKLHWQHIFEKPEEAETHRLDLS